MAEKCLIAASLAALVCHPSSTIKCFKPKPAPSTSPHKEKPVHKLPSKSKQKVPSPPTIPQTGDPFSIVSELVDGDPSMGIVETIFRSGWSYEVSLTIEKVLKVKHSVDALDRFEEHRERVKSKYANLRKRKPRLVADGNEVLQFHGASITCSLGRNGCLCICNRKCCRVCRTIASRRGSMSFHSSSWGAHEKVTTECALKGSSARKAMVICRVIAGRIASRQIHRFVDAEEVHFDSMVIGHQTSDSDSEELIVLDPKAVLPCFVVIYNVHKLP
ncbi:uncharacterized protein LOC120012423 [Tripterygium wilfordii]|uniref:uncharacterized protein LOC120012423 n=1 Tax=Tripterygium wilfordii TaxID=458696 RepID=UPI0018F84865|nr:uncharacterized protein LOC120012423 [Tripterygium wilfordii]